MRDILNVLLMIVSGFIVILVLLQSGKSDGLSATFTGSSDLNLFKTTKERGPEKVLSRMTGVMMVLFFGLTIGMQML